MRLWFHAPSAPLRQFVESIWFCENPGACGLDATLANGQIAMVLDLTGRPPVVVGASTQPGTLDAGLTRLAMGVQFRPAGAAAFFGKAVSSLRNVDVPLSFLWSSAEADDLRNLLLEAPDSKARVSELEKALYNRVRFDQLPPVGIVEFAAAALIDTPSVSDVVERTGYSQTRFVEIFRRATALTPKLFSRIQRFQRAVQLIHQGRYRDWSDVVSACRYYDQPHFNHDFRVFSGLNPERYASRRGPFPNHVPLVG